ncbi:MAG: hypothetical protein RIC16_08865 [Rhodospirillales bacterium]
MSEKKSSTGAATFVAAVIIVAALGGAGFVGFMELRKELRSAETATRSVIVELNTEIAGKIEDIDIGSGTGAGSQEIKASLENLRSAIDSVASQQVAMADALKQQLAEARDADTMAMNEERAERDAADATQSETVFFPMGKVAAPEVDEQIVAVLGKLSAYAGRPTCFAQVHGYSDTVGNDDVNLKLSRERADYVSAKVRAAGIRVASVDGWGERRLDMHTFDGVDNSRNRRVVVDITCRDADTRPVPTS